MRKGKEIEQNIPHYLKGSKTDMMIWTYVHAIKSLYPKSSINSIVSQFYKDFDFYHMYYSGVQNIFTKFNLKYNMSERGDCDNPLCNIYMIGTLETMLFAWCKCYELRVGYEKEQSALLFCEYFSIEWTPDQMAMFLNRISDIETAELSHPIVPKAFYTI